MIRGWGVSMSCFWLFFSDSTAHLRSPHRHDTTVCISVCMVITENLVSRDGFGSPVPRQPAHLHTQTEIWCLLTGLLPSSVVASIFFLVYTVCMYVWPSHTAEYGPTGQGCQSCSWSAEQGKLIFPCLRSRLRIWSRETGSAVLSRGILLILDT